MTLAPYRKLIAAVVGIVVLLVSRRTGIDLMPYQDLLVELVVSLVMMAAIYQVRNDPL